MRLAIPGMGAAPADSGGRARRRQRSPGEIAIAFLMWGYAFIVLAPLALIVLNSMRPSREIFRDPVGLPTSINFDSYFTAWSEASFSQYFFNSLFVTLAAVTLATATAGHSDSGARRLCAGPLPIQG